MIVMDLKLDNLFGFSDFEINFAYPKKLVNSTIDGEYLKTKPNFRYKKVNVIMGANASGKTTLGKAMMGIFNFIKKKNISSVSENISCADKAGFFSIDFISDKETMYRVKAYIDKGNEANIEIEVYYTAIGKKDSYETCVAKLELISGGLDYTEALSKISGFGWLFTYPESEANWLNDDNKTIDIKILKNVLQTLDSSIINVRKSKEVDNSYIVDYKNKSVLVQDNETVNKTILSSGTKSGIAIAYVLNSIKKNSHGFYYCDEKFSYIQSDVERAILSLMISFLQEGRQLFFTSHNLDLLDMNLPIHSFVFLKKEKYIEVIEPSKYMKKNDRALRYAVRNDIFNTSPDISKILELEEDI